MERYWLYYLILYIKLITCFRSCNLSSTNCSIPSLATHFVQRMLMAYTPAYCFIMDAQIRSLVCDYCWSTLFSVEGFKAAWESSLSGDTEPDLGYTYTTATWQEMKRSINFMCGFCEILHGEFTHYYHITKSERDPWGALTKYAGEPPADARFYFTIHFRRYSSSTPPLCLDISIGKFQCPSPIVYAESGNPAAEFIKKRGILTKQDSPEAYTLALQCIQECGSHHPRCLSPTREPLPTVIDCIDSTRPRHLINQSAPPDWYFALSYVWGEEQPHRTAEATLSSYTERINTKCIPKTIRDAIKVTHSLAFGIFGSMPLALFKTLVRTKQSK